MTAKVPQAQCDHILGAISRDGLIRASSCLPPDGNRRVYPGVDESFPHCPMCGCLNLSPTLIDELWKRHDEARAEANERDAVLFRKLQRGMRDLQDGRGWRYTVTRRTGVHDPVELSPTDLVTDLDGELPL